MPRPRAYSFDVFDTCLVRGFASGPDLIATAARRCAPAGDASEEVIGEAVRLRMEGERRARRHGADGSSLEEIYAAVPELAELGIRPSDMSDEEVRLERDTLRPVASTAARITRLRAAGGRIIFISDMHLPTAVIREKLLEFRIAQPDDPVYVSGDVGLSKASGRLYDHVLDAEGLRAHEVVHCGDDEGNDVLAARARGLLTVPFTAGRLNRYEREMLTAGPVDPDTCSRLAGISRLVRLSEPGEDEATTVAAAVGAGVVGPLFSGFVRGVLDDARRRGVERLYFVARDGQVFYEIAQVLRRPDDPECRYLYGSRAAWLLPGLTAEALAGAVDAADSHRTIRELLARLGVSPDQVAHELAEAGLDPDDRVQDHADRVRSLLTQAEPELLLRSHAAGTLLRHYARQEGLVDTDRTWALVDVGWSLNNQVALRQALGIAAPVAGYYLALQYARLPLRMAGRARARVREDYEGGRHVVPGGWLFNAGTLVEHVFCGADHGRCIGYRVGEEGQTEPVLSPPAPTQPWSEALRAAVLRWARAADDAGLLEDEGAAAFAAGDVAGRLLTTAPTRAEGRVLGSALVSDDIDERAYTHLARPLTLHEVVRRVQVQRALAAGASPEKRHWDSGAVAASPLPVRVAVRAGRSAIPRALRLRAALRGRLRAH